MQASERDVDRVVIRDAHSFQRYSHTLSVIHVYRFLYVGKPSFAFRVARCDLAVSRVDRSHSNYKLSEPSSFSWNFHPTNIPLTLCRIDSRENCMDRLNGTACSTKHSSVILCGMKPSLRVSPLMHRCCIMKLNKGLLMLRLKWLYLSVLTFHEIDLAEIASAP